MTFEIERQSLCSLVDAGRLMQLATLGSDGTPAICHVWYAHTFAPDRLYYISRYSRKHSLNIKGNPTVAGGIVPAVPSGLGDQVQGISFLGEVCELSVSASARPLVAFLKRWPRAKEAITINRLRDEVTQTRLYEVRVSEWVLFDEVNFPDEPRRVLRASDG